MSRRPTHEYEEITSDYAEELIRNTLESKSFKNRKITSAGTARFERIFREGRWDPFNGETIKIGRDARGVEVVIDGQNRLSGLAKCNGAVKRATFLVVRDVAKKSLRTVNANQRPRSGADVLDITSNGAVSDRNVCASVAKLWVAFETAGGWRSRPAITTILNERVDSDLLVDAYAEEPLIQEVTRWIRQHFSVTECPSLSLMAFCWLILRRRQELSVIEVDDFFERVGTGFGVSSKTDPVYLLRQKMISLKGKLQGANRASLVWFTLRTFRAVKRKEKLSRLQAPDQQNFQFLRP